MSIGAAEGPERSFTKLNFALAYARYGCRVFPLWWVQADGTCACGGKDGKPCAHPGKHPLYAGWQADATTDPRKVRRWWWKTPNANVGIATGTGSNLTVLDADGILGCDRLRELEVQHGDLPITPRAITGSGGLHEYFEYVPGLTNAVRWDTGLDLRTEGGLVVGVGSVNARGAYIWEVGYELSAELPPAKMPQWLIDAITRGQGQGNGNGTRFKMPEHPIVEGTGRNKWLYRLGRSLRAKGLPESAIRAALEKTNVERCQPPVDPGELGDILKSVLSQPDRPEFSAGRKSDGAGFPFRLTATAVEYKDGELWEFVCSRLEILSASRNTDGAEWGRLLRFRDSDDRVHELPLPMALLAGDGVTLRELLLGQGLIISPQKKARAWLMTYIQNSVPTERAHCVLRAGWHE
ncbi:MAG TPA: bifunctional DNA primase/polymerase [Candidatus Binataceae bacterium]|nr:bifunctional DNA primase/polymerase [Candidatus Binataceae bacterium]